MVIDRFAAIDFETANEECSSVCSVGVVWVENGRITDRVYRLIHPEPEYYCRANTLIHGLTDTDTQEAPVFSKVWEDIAPELEDMPLVAHNSRFDEACLKAAYRVYRMDYPDYRFYCTCRLARKYFKGLRNYKLPTVADYCGYHLEHHHHALADAEACAAIMTAILQGMKS